MLNLIISKIYNVSLKLRGYREHVPDPLQDKRFKRTGSQQVILQTKIDMYRELLVEKPIEQERDRFRRQLDAVVEESFRMVDRVRYRNGLC